MTARASQIESHATITILKQDSLDKASGEGYEERGGREGPFRRSWAGQYAEQHGNRIRVI